MNEFDLDALEKTVERAKAENFDSLAFSIDTVVIDQLIQRLREAETLLELKPQVIVYANEAQSTRIAQLERVREAAITHAATDPVRDMAPFIETRINLRAALAAVEEVAKA